MFQNIHRFAIIAGGALLILIGISAFGGMLESFRIVTPESLGSTGRNILLVIYLILFLVLAFAMVPVFLRVFTALQTSIGHGDLATVKSIKNNERIITYVIWGIFAGGFLIALPKAINDWFMTAK
jgi:hypothetical protein